MLAPLRRRGTEDQRIRRIKKWTRRGRVDLVARHFPGVWRFYQRLHGDILSLDPVDGLEELKKAIRLRLMTDQGEWFMEPDFGVPFPLWGTGAPRRT